MKPYGTGLSKGLPAISPRPGDEAAYAKTTSSLPMPGARRLPAHDQAAASDAQRMIGLALPSKRTPGRAKADLSGVESPLCGAAQGQGISAGFMREKEWRKLFIQGSTPEAAVRHAGTFYHNPGRSLSGRGRWR
jgi:hypothetical protein